jgi:hypothetical protein
MFTQAEIALLIKAVREILFELHKHRELNEADIEHYEKLLEKLKARGLASRK